MISAAHVREQYAQTEENIGSSN